MKKPLNTPDLRKNVAQVEQVSSISVDFKSTEIEDTCSAVSEELLHGP
jgi:hypothetical protein